MSTDIRHALPNRLLLDRPDDDPDAVRAVCRARAIVATHTDLRDIRYLSFGRYLRRRFGAQVHKVTLHAGFTCPNRDGRCGVGGCIYCVNESFSPNTLVPGRPIALQMREGMDFCRRRFGAQKFFAYFQTFTNTYAPLDVLRGRYDEALAVSDDIVGLSIGTRPDCVPDATLDLLESYADRCEVWVEYGLQSMHDETLRRINRGHGLDAFLDALDRTRGRRLHVCSHIILGLPGENWSHMMQTADFLAGLDVIESLKIHHLYVARGTALADQYAGGLVSVLSFDDYVTLACDFVERTPPTVAFQRIVGDTTSPSLIAPVWNMPKAAIPQAVSGRLRERGTCQGARSGPARSSEAVALLPHRVRPSWTDSTCPR